MSVTLYFDHINGKAEAVYPCRCGQTHRGPHAVYDYGHHNCFHDSPLLSIEETGDLVCPDCGKVFEVAS